MAKMSVRGLIIEQGSAGWEGQESVTVSLSAPFGDPPDVVISNVEPAQGIDQIYIGDVTSTQFTVYNSMHNASGNFSWRAVGIPK